MYSRINPREMAVVCIAAEQDAERLERLTSAAEAALSCMPYGTVETVPLRNGAVLQRLPDKHVGTQKARKPHRDCEAYVVATPACGRQATTHKDSRLVAPTLKAGATMRMPFNDFAVAGIREL